MKVRKVDEEEKIEFFTDANVRRIKLPPKPKDDDDKLPQKTYFQKLERGLSLMLVVSYGGSKSWRAVTYRNSKPQSRKLVSRDEGCRSARGGAHILAKPRKVRARS